MSARPVRALAALAAALLVAALAPAGSAAAASAFEAPTAGASFGKEVTFRQAFTADVPLARVEVLLSFPGATGTHVVEAAGATAAGRHALTYRWSLAEDGHLAPNTTITARWRLVPADRGLPPVVGPETTVRYADTRFAWRTLEGDVVRLHWYEGSDTFGRRALAIGERAVADAAGLLGVIEAEPIDFFVYAEEGAFYDALGPATRENVGGQAHSDIRTMFALIGPGDVADPWVGIVIPHELTHLVFDTAVRNPYRFPPRWLNEGVATYLSQGYTAADRAAVEAAARAGRLMPLRALGGQFPTTYERFSLAYSQSVSAVDHLVRTKGEEALVRLVRSYAGGVTDDEAFEQAVGRNLAEFEGGWLRELGAKLPARHGPQPAPAGPLPGDWTAAATPAPGETSAAGATAPPEPTVPPGGTAADEGSPLAGGALLAAALAVLLGGGSIGYLRLRRRREQGEAGGPP